MPNNAKIHPTAVVDDKAKIADDVEIGPYCIIGPDVTLKAGVKLRAHVNIDCNCTVGEGTEIFPFVSFSDPQDLKFKGENSRLIIGKNNIIREHVTMNPGTEADRMETTVGDNNLFMIGSHVAHDCIVGSNVIMANNATLAGHVIIEDGAIIGGLSAIRQKVRIGHNAMIGGMTGVEKDVIPYGLVMGDRGHLAGLNLVGLERAGLPKKQINGLRRAYKAIFLSDDDIFSSRVEKAANEFDEQELVQRMIAFVNGDSANSLTQPRKKA